jgi:hypothetical protein
MLSYFRHLGVATAVMATVAFAQEALASRAVQQGFDRSQCSNGMCTILRVIVELNSSSQEPVVRIARHDFDDGFTAYNYDTVVQRADDVCSKDVIVPADVFNAVGAVFRSITIGGTPSPVLTPTQQTLLLFYTTLLQQTQGFECSPRDLGEVNIPSVPTAPPAPAPLPQAPVFVPPVQGGFGPFPPAPQPYVPGNTGGVIFQ